MTYLKAALHRAAAEGVLTVPHASRDTVPSPEPASATAVEHPADAAGGRQAVASRVHGLAPDWDRLSHLPPAVVGQLGNLAQALQSHPRRPRTVAFVGSGRGEGTSTCVASLAAYLSSAGARVLMVDANVHHPNLHAIAGVEQEPGLAELIAGRIDVDAAIKRGPTPNLFVVTSGERERAGGNGYVPGTALRERLLDFTGEYDFVLVDCPAVNVYEDAAVTAATCEATVLVIEGGRTPRHAAQASKALLARANCTILGVFMNKRKFYIPQFLYDRL